MWLTLNYNGVLRLNEVFKLLAETLISVSVFYMLKSTKLLLPVKSLGLFLYNPMYKEIKYTSHMKLMGKKNTFKLAGRCKLLLIQEKLDGSAAESCKSGWTWLWKPGFVLKIFFTAWTLRRNYFSSDMHKPEVLNLCRASVVMRIQVALSKANKCCPITGF